MPGVTIGSSISGSLDAKNIVMGVLQKAVELSNLQAILGATVSVPELTATIPVCTAGAVTEDVDEMVTTDIEGGSFTNVDFSLKKDRVKLAVSDEAGMRSKAGDPLDIQVTGAGAFLASVLDKKIITALEVTPQTGAAAGLWSTVTVNPLVDLGTAVAALLPYKADFIVMPAAVWAQYLKNDFLKTAFTGNPAALQGAVGRVPGLNLDIFVNSNCTAKSATVGARNGMAVVLGNGPVKVRKWDDPNAGATRYQMDVFRQVKSTIFPNASNLSMAAYKLTAVIA